MLPLAIFAPAAPAHPQPPLTLQFSTTMRVAQGWGHDGDGCLAAEAALAKSPVISRIWFDKPGQRLAQTNPGLRLPDPTPNLTVIGLYATTPPTELDLDTRTYGPICDTEPLPDVYCNNGSRTCPPVFGDFGFGHLNALTSVLGSNYYNTTLLTKQKGADIWQCSWTNPTEVLVNGTIKVINITRNYSYTLANAASARPDGTRPLHRFVWTQSIPLLPALPVHRDCFLFDYSQDYVPGAIDPARWLPPPGVKCQNGSVAATQSAGQQQRTVEQAA